METHAIQLNAYNALPSKPWAFHSDTELYPIFKVCENSNQFSRIHSLLQDVKLEGNDISDIQILMTISI